MIVREMDLNSSIYVVHRGKIVISQGGKKITTLTKVSDQSFFAYLLLVTSRGYASFTERVEREFMGPNLGDFANICN